MREDESGNDVEFVISAAVLCAVYVAAFAVVVLDVFYWRAG